MTRPASGIVAIIPARGGSKGIPRKNLRLIAGKPLVAYAIECALNARLVGRVFVSTDDAEIAATSKAFGAEVIIRPAELSGDTASSEVALLHALDHLRSVEAVEPPAVAFLQATSPLTAPEDVDGTLEVLDAHVADSALAVTIFHHFLWKLDGTGNAIGVNHEKSVRLPRQACAPQYLETGAVYAFLVPGFRQHRHRFFGKTALYVMPSERALEIDDFPDLEMAELLVRRQEEKTHAAMSTNRRA
ncbi:MAG TPA: acylneuraminate cytidylyltransferase family protein [Bryobacteraceae bacterium]|nr:acylneuraminate cytidylyltransferase family protein [Bryobacteraceae bacterium]